MEDTVGVLVEWDGGWATADDLEHAHEVAMERGLKICEYSVTRNVSDNSEPLYTGDCMDHAEPYVSDGPLGHGFECGQCGRFLQAG